MKFRRDTVIFEPCDMAFVKKVGFMEAADLASSSVSNDYKRELRQEVYFTLKFGAADSIIKGSRTDYILDGKPETERYLYHLLGKVQYVLWVEPDNKWFFDAKQGIKEMMRGQNENGRNEQD